MRIFDVNKPQVSPALKHWIYNANDCMVTLEVWQKQLPLLHETNQWDSYQRSCGENAAAFAMSQHGLVVDEVAKERVRQELDDEITALEAMLDEFAIARFERRLNPRSHKDKKELLYGYSPPKPGTERMIEYPGATLGLKRIYSFKGGKRSCTCDRNALEQLAQRTSEAALFANLLNLISDLSKQKEVFDALVDKDNRMRCAYNVAGTDTFRWSSNGTPEFTGRNLQNISEPLRDMFEADQGKIMIYADYEQAESRIVAYITGDQNYIKACEGGDLHTTVCQMVWPELDWPSDPKQAKALAETIFYRHFTRRDMSKRGGHATNYYGKPMTVAKNLNVETALIRSFQDNYFEVFPGITDWHEQTKHRLLIGEPIVTAFGRTRKFFGRSNTDDTLRKAIAFEPQSTLSSLVKEAHVRALRAEWREPWAKSCGFRICHDLHDAMLVQCWKEAEAEVRERLEEIMKIPVNYPSGTMIIPVEMKAGLNWGAYDKDKNPGGLTK